MTVETLSVMKLEPLKTQDWTIKFTSKVTNKNTNYDRRWWASNHDLYDVGLSNSKQRMSLIDSQRLKQTNKPILTASDGNKNLLTWKSEPLKTLDGPSRLTYGPIAGPASSDSSHPATSWLTWHFQTHLCHRLWADSRAGQIWLLTPSHFLVQRRPVSPLSA